MAAVTSVTEYNGFPAGNLKIVVITYTKANAGDTIDMSTYQMQNVRYVSAKDDTAGADDPCTWSGSTITFSTNTGSGSAVVFGESK